MGMLIHLHSQATTTPKVRAAIQASDEVGTVLAERFGVTPQTIYKWRKRDTVEDRSHTPHRLQTTLTPAQEVVAVALRKALLISLDDLLAVVREFLNPHVSRSGLDRCLRRHGVGNLRDLKAKAARPKHSGFKAYEPGYIHIDVKYLPQMADETSRRYLFVAIDRATRWVFIRIFKAKTAANARRFLRDLERACPMRIRTILTDNAKEFTDRLFGLRKRAPTGEHEFDKLCADLDIDHRLTPPKSPQTNGMVERFNGRIEEVLQSHHFRSGEELEATLHRYVWLYNQQLPQSALGSRSPLQAMKDWYTIKHKLFKKRPYYLPGCESYHHHIGLIFIDLDDMKHWNDDYGHAAGDAALKAVGAAITARIREVDICKRIGGDEFAILGYVCNRGDLTTIITRIRNVLQTTRISVPGSKKPIHETPKISAGASVFFEPVKESLEEMMDMADREMYRDKNRKK